MRYQAIDFYRGLTIAFMIIVNSPGSWEHIYAPLKHANWHGCTPTDLVFPSFMFIIGVSMWFSFDRYQRKWSSEVGWKVLNRVSLLFLIGLLLNKFPIYWSHIEQWRIWGVPQRLALGYGLAAILVLNFNRKWLMWISGVLLLLYWGLLYWASVPGQDPLGLATNAVLRIDRWMLGEGHLWHGEGIAFDPEGLLSTIPSVVTVLLGWLAGELLQYRSERRDLAVRDLLVYGIMCGFAGMFWDLFFPINKKLWTSSYVLYAGGLSMLFLAGSVWAIEIRKWRWGYDMMATFGANAIFAYVLSEVLLITCTNIKWTEAGGKTISLWDSLYQQLAGLAGDPKMASAIFAVAYMLICWLICRILYIRKVFIKI